MTTTKSLSKIWSPRWITTARNYEGGETASASIMVTGEQLNRRTVTPPAVSKSEVAPDALSRIRTLLQTNLTKNSLTELINRRSMSAPASPSRKVIQNTHTTSPSQCFVEAMSECHTSVNQFYGLEATTKDDIAATSAPVATKSLSTNKTSSKKIADIAAKQSKICQAKALRISLTETNRRMRSLTLNMLTPGISAVSRMTRIKELCEHAKNYPATRTIAVKVDFQFLHTMYCILFMLTVIIEFLIMMEV